MDKEVSLRLFISLLFVYFSFTPSCTAEYVTICTPVTFTMLCSDSVHSYSTSSDTNPISTIPCSTVQRYITESCVISSLDDAYAELMSTMSQCETETSVTVIETCKNSHSYLSTSCRSAEGWGTSQVCTPTIYSTDVLFYSSYCEPHIPTQTRVSCFPPISSTPSFSSWFSNTIMSYSLSCETYETAISTESCNSLSYSFPPSSSSTTSSLSFSSTMSSSPSVRCEPSISTQMAVSCFPYSYSVSTSPSFSSTMSSSLRCETYATTISTESCSTLSYAFPSSSSSTTSSSSSSTVSPSLWCEPSISTQTVVSCFPHSSSASTSPLFSSMVSSSLSCATYETAISTESCLSLPVYSLHTSQSCWAVEKWLTTPTCVVNVNPTSSCSPISSTQTIVRCPSSLSSSTEFTSALTASPSKSVDSVRVMSTMRAASSDSISTPLSSSDLAFASSSKEQERPSSSQLKASSSSITSTTYVYASIKPTATAAVASSSAVPTTRPPEGTKRAELYKYDGDSEIPNSCEYIWGCFKISLNKTGIRFYGNRHYKLYICRNGVVTFNARWVIQYPYRLSEKRWWLKGVSLLAPYWGFTDTHFHFDNSDCPWSWYNKRQNATSEPSQTSHVYYRVYQKDDGKDGTDAVLANATAHVREYQNDMSEFSATWVLVVTWVKLFPYNWDSWRYWYYNEWDNFNKEKRSNTFQLVLVTDGIYTFTIYNYPENGIQWINSKSSEKYHYYWYSARGLPVVGYQAGDEKRVYKEVPGSGSAVIESIDDAYSSTTNKFGSWFFRLEDSTGADGQVECMKWYDNEPDPEEAIKEGDLACPCTFWQGLWDSRYWFDWWNANWYSSVICLYQREAANNGWGVKCCYDSWIWWDSGLEGPPHGGNAYKHFLSRFYDSQTYQKHKTEDIDPYKSCCIESQNCPLYYEKRPSVDCSNYDPVEIRWNWGDPHFITLDGSEFTFNGVGEYVLVNIEVATGKLFQLQARTKALESGGNATIFTAAVANETGASAVEVQAKAGGGMMVLIDGAVFSNYSRLTNKSEFLSNYKVDVSKPAENSFKVSFPSGIGITISEAKEMLTIVFAGSKNKFGNKTTGLYGNWNGIKKDDLMFRNGTIFAPVNMTGRQLHFDYAMHWQISQEESCFTYKNGENVSTFSVPNFKPMFADEISWASPELEAKAKNTCGNDHACLFDIASTQDVSIGEATKGTGDKLVKDRQENVNTPPRIMNAEASINLTINDQFRMTVTGYDKDGDNFTITVDKLPSGATLTKTGNDSIFSWTPSTNSIDPFAFVITDSVGASSRYSPKIMLCACLNNGTCVDKTEDEDGPPQVSSAKFELKPCKCTEGFSGKQCEDDIDACAENYEPCYPGVKCTDLPAPANRSGFECGDCPVGYQGDGQKCDDVDECKNKTTSSCEQICINTPGSYQCDCEPGYSLAIDKRTCQDIDECLTGHDCMHTCSNTIGGYTCGCNTYFKLNTTNNKTCIPEDPCSNSKCLHVCYKADGLEKCACNAGYKLNEDGKNCDDIDECADNTDRCDSTCKNTEGGYICSCSEGFNLAQDKYTCEDINECLQLSLFNCNESMGCVNIRGSYKCECLGEDIFFIDGACRALDKDEKTPEPAPPPAPKNPTEEEINSAEKITAKNMMKKEWTGEVEKKVKEEIAKTCTEFCYHNKDECIKSLARRKRRSASIIEFTVYDVHLLPNYPQQKGDNLVIAIYVNLPKGVNSQNLAIDKETLHKIINETLGDISAVLGNRTVVFTQPEPQVEDKPDGTDVGLIVGLVFACFFGCLLIAGLMFFCYKRSLQPNKVTFAMDEEARKDDEEFYKKKEETSEL